MGTLTDAVISTTYKSLIFQKATNTLWYTSGGDADVEFTTFNTGMTFSAAAVFTNGIKLDNIVENTGDNGVTIDTVKIQDGNIRLGPTGQIQDANGNEAIVCYTVASADNYLQVIPSTDENAVLVSTSGSGTNPGLTLDAKGDGVITTTPQLVATLGVKLGNNIIYNSEGTATLTLDTDEDLTIAGDLAVEGDIIEIGGSDDATDKSITFRHDTCETIIGIDDSQESAAGAFIINTDNAGFNATKGNNDLLLDGSGNLHIGNGRLRLTTIGYTDGTLGMTIASDGKTSFDQRVTIEDNLVVTGTDGVANSFANATTFSGVVTATGKLVHLYSATTAETGDFTAAVNKIHLITDLGGCAVTLPTPSVGARIKLVFGGLSSSGPHTVTTDAVGTLYNGYLLMADTDDGSSAEFEVHAPNGSSHRVITMNGGTQGKAGIIEFIGTANNRWYVEGELHANGTVATPFS